jgi:hypothetical protein
MLLANLQGKLDDGTVRATFEVLCARSGQIAVAARQRAEALVASFEAPLKEAARTVKSVQAAVADRSAALSQFAQVCAVGLQCILHLLACGHVMDHSHCQPCGTPHERGC